MASLISPLCLHFFFSSFQSLLIILSVASSDIPLPPALSWTVPLSLESGWIDSPPTVFLLGCVPSCFFYSHVHNCIISAAQNHRRARVLSRVRRFALSLSLSNFFFSCPLFPPCLCPSFASSSIPFLSSHLISKSRLICLFLML